MGHAEIVEKFIYKVRSSKVQALRTLNAVDNQLRTPLHYAVIGGDMSTVAELLSNSTLRASLTEMRKNLPPLQIASTFMKKTHEAPRTQTTRKAVQEFNVIISMLLERPEVKAVLEIEDRDRQNLNGERQVFARVFVDAANAMLVGAALIASITFAGWLQPPLGFQQYFETRYQVMGLAPPGTYQSFAAVKHHWILQVFWIFNSLSFYFAIATVLTGVGAVLPSQETIGKADVKCRRKLLIRTSMVLSFSVVFGLGAFIAAAFASLPPTVKYEWGMLATSGVGGSMCITLQYYFSRKLFRLFLLENVLGHFKER